jgi:hypothetical protein
MELLKTAVARLVGNWEWLAGRGFWKYHQNVLGMMWNLHHKWAVFMYVDSKLIGISLAWTCFKKEHCKYRVLTKGLFYILRNCCCNMHAIKAVFQLQEDLDLWHRCSVCPPLTCTLYQNMLKCLLCTSTTRRLCTRKFYIAHLDTSIDLSVFSAILYILFFDMRYFDYDWCVRDLHWVRQIWSLS